MIYNNVILRVESDRDVEAVKSLLKRCARLSREEPGCERFEVYQSNEEPQLFFLIEHWESQEALDRHREQYAFQEIYMPSVLPKATRVPHPSRRVA